MNCIKLLIAALFSQTVSSCQVLQEATSCNGRYIWRIESSRIYKKEGHNWINVRGQLNNGIVVTNIQLFGINSGGRVYYKPVNTVNVDWKQVPNVLLTNIYYNCDTNKLTGIDTESYLVLWNGKSFDRLLSMPPPEEVDE